MTAAVLLLALWVQASSFEEQGLKALEAGDYLTAIKAFRQLVEDRPDDYSSRFHLALAYSLSGRTSEAVEQYRKVLELKPDLYEAQLNLGILLVADNRPAEALPLLERARAQRPGEFKPHYYLGEAYRKLEQWQQASFHYEMALKVDPQSAAAEIGLGRILARQGQLEEAARHYHRAVELSAEYRLMLLELAEEFEKAGRAQDAARLYEQFPEDPGAQERLGALLLEAGEVERAIAVLQKVVAQAPTPASRYLLAMAYVRAGQRESALPFLEGILAEQPEQFDVRMTYGRVLRDLKRYENATQQFLHCVQMKPDSQEAWQELAGMFILLDRYPEALAALDRVEQLGHAPVGIHFLRAIIFDKTRQYEAALASYQRFLELSQGQHPDQEFQARQRIRVIKRELGR